MGGGQLSIGGGMRGDDKAFGIGFRKEFNDGSVCPKSIMVKELAYSSVEDEVQARKHKILNKFIKDLKKFIKTN